MLNRTLILILYSVCTSGSLRPCFKLKWNSISLYILFVFSVKLHSRCIRLETQRYKENVSIRSLPLKEKYLLLCHKGVTTHEVCPSGRPLKPVLWRERWSGCWSIIVNSSHFHIYCVRLKEVLHLKTMGLFFKLRFLNLFAAIRALKRLTFHLEEILWHVNDYFRQWLSISV